MGPHDVDLMSKPFEVDNDEFEAILDLLGSKKNRLERLTNNLHLRLTLWLQCLRVSSRGEVNYEYGKYWSNPSGFF